MSRLSQVLLFDSDTRGRDILAYGFEGDAVSARVANTVAEAMDAAADTPPDVLVAVWRSTQDDSWELLRRFSADESLRAIPRLALSAAVDLPAELRELPGSTSFLPLPAFVRDVVTAAKLLVGITAGAAQSDPEVTGALSGTLSEFGLLFIVRTMVGLRRSGIVQVERAHRKGELRFSDGGLVSATVGSLQGQPALHQLLLWEEGALEVKLRSVTQHGALMPQGEELLEDLDRFLRDFEHATKSIGHAQSLYIQDMEKTASLVGDGSIPAEVLPVMKLFDGHRNLGDVLEDSPFLAFDTLKIIGRLVEMGTIRRKAIEKPSAGVAPQRRVRVDEWVQRRKEAPAVRAAPTPVPNGNLESSGERTGFGHRKRSRRRTGEMPLAEALDSGDARGTMHEVATSSEPRFPPPSPPPDPPAVVEIPPTHQRPRAGELVATGELRADRQDREPSPTPSPDKVPKVVVDLGPVDPVAEAEPAVAMPAPAHQKDSPNRDSGAVFEAAAVAPPPAAPLASAVPDEAAPDRRLQGVRSAEIDTGMRPAPAPELLSPPNESGGPSIMLDPHLVAEMDAFELANTAATPPPVVNAAAPAAAPAPAAPSPVVSFVHGATNLSPHAGLPLNAAPTVPVVPVAGAPARQPGANPPAAGATPPPAAGSPAAGDAARRGSGEFNALEADFFAREQELYQHEPTESFDDLDPVTRQRRRT
jgi:hypothetical protein